MPRPPSLRPPRHSVMGGIAQGWLLALFMLSAVASAAADSNEGHTRANATVNVTQEVARMLADVANRTYAALRGIYVSALDTSIDSQSGPDRKKRAHATMMGVGPVEPAPYNELVVPDIGNPREFLNSVSNVPRIEALPEMGDDEQMKPRLFNALICPIASVGKQATRGLNFEDSIQRPMQGLWANPCVAGDGILSRYFKVLREKSLLKGAFDVAELVKYAMDVAKDDSKRYHDTNFLSSYEIAKKTLNRNLERSCASIDGFLSNYRWWPFFRLLGLLPHFPTNKNKVQVRRYDEFGNRPVAATFKQEGGELKPMFFGLYLTLLDEFIAMSVSEKEITSSLREDNQTLQAAEVGASNMQESRAAGATSLHHEQ